MRVEEAVGSWLAHQGVRAVFGVVGSGNFRVTNALRAGGAEFVAARHETGAACMADGYARSTGRLGMVSVHQGPGFTNAITGLVEAAKSRTPLLALAADTPGGARTSNFRIDQAGVATAAGIEVEALHTPASALADAARAYHRAVRERRTVALLLPLDVARAELPLDHDPPILPPVPAPCVPSRETISRLAELLGAAERPVVVAGRGAVLAGARDVLVALGERTGALLATSAVAHGFFRDVPFNVGIAGGFSTPLAVELLAQADLVMGFGASLNRWTTRDGTLFPDTAQVVQVDLDPTALGFHRPVDLGVVGDVAETAHEVVASLDDRGVQRTGYRTDAVADQLRRGRWRDQHFDDRSTADRIDPRTLTIALDDLVPEQRTITIDSGHFMGWPTMYLDSPDGRGFLFNQAFMAVGVGLGGAIGVAIGRPDRLTVATVGDGGAFMALGELETIARLGLPMLVVVYNDDAYGAEVHHFPREPLDTVRFPDSDIAAVARGAGAEAATVRRVDDLKCVKDWLQRRDGPLVLDAKVHPEVVGEWLEEAFRGE